LSCYPVARLIKKPNGGTLQPVCDAYIIGHRQNSFEINKTLVAAERAIGKHYCLVRYRFHIILKYKPIGAVKKIFEFFFIFGGKVHFSAKVK
jgi:hypothetical protein